MDHKLNSNINQNKTHHLPARVLDSGKCMLTGSADTL